jgi:translation initiation factor 1A
MVKNVYGGNKHKSQARKNTVKTSIRLRVAENEGELYGVVIKMLGNGMFHVHCIDDITRLGHIRGKFSGRGKRDNIVEIGKWVLIGEREWDISSTDKTNKNLKCDLLNVYNELDKEKLMDTVSKNWSVLTSHDSSKIKDNNNTDDFRFTTEREEESERLMAEINANRTTAMDLNTNTNTKTDDTTNSNDWIDDI